MTTPFIIMYLTFCVVVLAPTLYLGASHSGEL